MTLRFGGTGVNPTVTGTPSQAFTLQAGAFMFVPPGTWNIQLGGFTVVQEYDQVQKQWINNGGANSDYRYVTSDGNNFRLANLCGCVVGLNVTTAGTGYTTAAPPTITASAGAATIAAVIGGAVSTSVTVTNGGTNYTYPPMIFLDPPPASGTGGLQATGYGTLSGTTLSTITIDNQGAGYTNVPNIYIQPDARDVTGSGASAVAVLTGAGTITAAVVTNPGTPLTTQPTFTVSSGSGAVAAIMVRTASGYTVTVAGSGYSGTVEISALGSGLTSTNATTNPKWTTNLVRTRKASIIAGVTNTSITTSGFTVLDGGIYAGSAPSTIVYGSQNGTSILAGSVALTWANVNDTVQLNPAP